MKYQAERFPTVVTSHAVREALYQYLDSALN
jgi:hypothetical protein